MAEALQGADSAQPVADLLESVGVELSDARQHVYLVTFARLLAATLAANPARRDPSGFSREQIGSCLQDAIDNPMADAVGGRPRSNQGGIVVKYVVFRETHQDGSYHFHIAAKLTSSQRFSAFKRTLLQRHGLVFVPSEAKPVVDAQCFQWAADGLAWDLFEASQEPFRADSWRQRREKKDKQAEAEGKSIGFTKLDLLSLVLSKNLRTKRKLLTYAQNHGTVPMQSFLSKHQRRLPEFIEDALEWESAPAESAVEELTDWDLLCQAADQPCPHGDQCVYKTACDQIFELNAASFSWVSLAVALRSVIVSGPSKTRRVPFLVGSTNSGKSTLLESFDSLFGEVNVFHLPALTDKRFALRNWLRHKRFVFWDEFKPVQFAEAECLPIPQFLKAFNGDLFEIQVPQNAHDGNVDFRWTRGAAFTAKERGLFTPAEFVTAEDIFHIKARVHLFRCSARLPRLREGGVPQCRHHLAQWIRAGASIFDAAGGLRPALPTLAVEAGVDVGVGGGVQGLAELLRLAAIPEMVARSLGTEILELGAVHIRELSVQDWCELAAWGGLRPLQQRRLLASLQT
ncbi:unnamed protein product [Polarella glacialis]|uniref:Uncharacterized protein n=1 Tax=Polarella glacialis TaxID=89957 RepID=A0A813JDX4_POLGL|nr:unnamed protein product [Polarella glacialis]